MLKKQKKYLQKTLSKKLHFLITITTFYQKKTILVLLKLHLLELLLSLPILLFSRFNNFLTTIMILILHGAKVYAAPALANLTILCFENLYTLKVHLTQNELAAPILRKIGILSIKSLKNRFSKKNLHI